MPSELALLKRARKFNRTALAEIYDCYSPELFRYAYRLLGDPALAEDCVADTFRQFLSVLKRGGGPQRYLRAYLYRIAHNWVCDYYRRQPPPDISIDSMQLSDPGEEPFTKIAQRDDIKAVRAALVNLTPEQRQVVVLKYLEGWSNAEVAQAMQKPVGAVKALHHRAIQGLRRALNRDRSMKDAS